MEIYAEMGPLVVVVGYGLLDCQPSLVYALECPAVEQLVFYGAVYALCHRVVFGVPVLCHTWHYT